MNLQLVGIILAAIFFLTTVILTLKVIKKKKPVYVLNTNKIIGIGAESPKEIKIYFGDTPVNDVYKTTVKFWNRGNDVIHDSIVTEKIALHFKSAQILREPEIIMSSSASNKINVNRVIKDGDEAIEINFWYLDHGDGASFEVIHTNCSGISASGNIIGAKFQKIDEFERPYFMFRVKSPLLAALATTTFFFIMGVTLGELIREIANNEINYLTLSIFIFSTLVVLSIIALGVIPYFMYKPPKWSTKKY